jgi:uncharacterized protein (DUF2336 family)
MQITSVLCDRAARMESGSLWSLDNLALPGSRDGVDMRPTLIRVLTDLYVQKLTHSYEEKRHYTELALRLLDSVDAATRLAVATRLARHMSPPVRVMVKLASDLPDIAAVVRSHPVLLPKEHQSQHQSRSPNPAPAQVPPKAPSPSASAAPSSDPPRTAPRPAAPAVAPAAATAAASAVLPDSARGPDPIKPPEVPAPLAPPLPPKRETPQRPAAPDAIAADVAGELNEQFFAASAEERRLILLNLHIVLPMPVGRVSVSREALGIERLENAALSHNREDFAAYLAQSLRISRMQARRIAADDLGEPVVAAAKALAMPRDVLYRILLFINPTIGHSVARVHALAALFDEMTLPAAEHMVAIWQALLSNERSIAPQHPLTRDEEARTRARNATETVRRAPAPRRPGDRRDVS